MNHLWKSFGFKIKKKLILSEPILAKLSLVYIHFIFQLFCVILQLFILHFCRSFYPCAGFWNMFVFVCYKSYPSKDFSLSCSASKFLIFNEKHIFYQANLWCGLNNPLIGSSVWVRMRPYLLLQVLQHAHHHR